MTKDPITALARLAYEPGQAIKVDLEGADARFIRFEPDENKFVVLPRTGTAYSDEYECPHWRVCKLLQVADDFRLIPIGHYSAVRQTAMGEPLES